MKFSVAVPEEDGNLNMTALVDVVFLLLLFFMVTSSLRDETSLAVNLPESSAEAVVAESEPLTVVINLEGDYYINGKRLPDAAVELLMNALREAAGETPEPLLNIHADRQVAYEKVVRVMEAARRLGYERLNVAVTKK